MPDRSYRVLLWSLALLGLAADQASKYGVFHWLRPVEGGAAADALEHRCFAIFQTVPESRTFSLQESGSVRKGFALAPDYKRLSSLKQDEKLQAGEYVGEDGD